MSRVWEIWRVLGAAIAALLLGASQIDPNPLPWWVFPTVAVVALLSLLFAWLQDRRARR